MCMFTVSYPLEISRLHNLHLSPTVIPSGDNAAFVHLAAATVNHYILVFLFQQHMTTKKCIGPCKSILHWWWCQWFKGYILLFQNINLPLFWGTVVGKKNLQYLSALSDTVGNTSRHISSFLCFHTAWLAHIVYFFLDHLALQDCQDLQCLHLKNKWSDVSRTRNAQMLLYFKCL